MKFAPAIVLALVLLAGCGPALIANPGVATTSPSLAAATAPPPVPATTFATRPAETVPPAAAAANLCPITATRTPPPGAPTYIPGGPNPPRGPVDPHVEICASGATLHAGETLTLTGLAVDVGLPYYTLFVKQDQADWQPVAAVTYENVSRGPTKSTPLFQFTSAKGSMRQATFVLHALGPGEAEFRISATGEIHYGYPGPAVFAGGDSSAIRVIVTGP